MNDAVLTICLMGGVSVVSVLLAKYLEKRINELQALSDKLYGRDLNERGSLYLDADTTPYAAATLILAAMGPVYVNALIDGLIDVLEVQPSKE